MTSRPVVYKNSAEHPCFAVAPEDTDEVLLLLRAKGIAAEVRSLTDKVTEVEFIDLNAVRVARLLEHLWKHH